MRETILKNGDTNELLFARNIKQNTKYLRLAHLIKILTRHRLGIGKDTRHIRLSQPCMVVGACPSIDTQHDFIKEFQRDGGLIFCTDRAYKALQAHGTRPDYCGTLDPSADTTGWLDGYDGPVLCSLKANPGLVAQVHKQSAFYFPGLKNFKTEYVKIINRYNLAMYNEYGCISDFLFLFCILHGASEIMVIGCEGWFYGYEIYDNIKQDYLFNITQYYADPIMHRRSCLYKKNEFCFPVEDYDGKTQYCCSYPRLYEDMPGTVKKYTTDMMQFNVEMMKKIPGYLRQQMDINIEVKQ